MTLAYPPLPSGPTGFRRSTITFAGQFLRYWAMNCLKSSPGRRPRSRPPFDCLVDAHHFAVAVQSDADLPCGLRVPHHEEVLTASAESAALLPIFAELRYCNRLIRYCPLGFHLSPLPVRADDATACHRPPVDWSSPETDDLPARSQGRARRAARPSAARVLTEIEALGRELPRSASSRVPHITESADGRSRHGR